MKINKKNYIKAFIKIQTKESDLINLDMNYPQQKMYKVIKRLEKEGKPVRIVVLKARQMGFSTLTSALFTTDTVTNIGRKTAVVAHTEESTKEIFLKYKVMVNNLPKELQPQMSASNAQEIVFDTRNNDGIGGRIRCMTAGGEGIGRGSTIHNLHISEYAFWKGDKQDTLLGLLQAVPYLPNTSVIIESTANGMDHFKDIWDLAVEGKSGFVPVFCAWWELESNALPVPKGFKLTEEEKKVKAQFNLTDEQMVWRRTCVYDNCQGDLEKFHQEYPACPEEAFISSGGSVFDKDIVVNRINEIRDIKPLKQGYFVYDNTYIDSYNVQITNMKWIDDANGAIKIFREPFIINGNNKVKDGIPYVLGADTAGDGSDYSAGHVIDNITGNQVAVIWKDKIDEDLFAEQLYCLGKYYNDALIGVEANFSTVAIRKLNELNYPNMYVREQVDSMTHQTVKKFGFITSVKTRPIIIGNLIAIVRESINNINDIETLKEMLTFVKDDRGRGRAESGKHDDLVMSLAITFFIAGQQIGYKTEQVEEERNFVSSFFSKKEKEEGGYIEW